MVCYFYSVSRLLIWYDLSQRRRNNKLYLLLLKTKPPWSHMLPLCRGCETTAAAAGTRGPAASFLELLSAKLNTQSFFFSFFFSFFLSGHQWRGETNTLSSHFTAALFQLSSSLLFY